MALFWALYCVDSLMGFNDSEEHTTSVLNVEVACYFKTLVLDPPKTVQTSFYGLEKG
jgi:hypothetical protein